MITPAPLRLAIAQVAPIFNQRKASLKKLASAAHEAAAAGAKVVIFGETWLTGYPAWIDHVPGIALWGNTNTQEVYADMLSQAWWKDSPADHFLQQLAKDLGIFLFLGVNERTGKTSLFNTLLLYNPEGVLALHHRKLMPTFTEKLLYTTGDAFGLEVVKTPYGRMGGLICWEHWMPLSRQALHQQREHLHLALWPTVTDIHQLASRHYAFEGRTFVIAAGQILRVGDLPSFFRQHIDKNNHHLLLRGGSAIIRPDGSYLLPPVYDEEKILYADIDEWHMVEHQGLTLDVSSHYARPDIFSLTIKKQRYDLK